MKYLCRYLVLFLFIYIDSLDAYESEDRLKTAIVGKLAKYVSWDKEHSFKFVITVLGNEFGTLFKDIYLNKRIKSKPVKIHYIKSIYEIGDSDILFISRNNRDNIEKILKYTQNRGILTISDKRGFTQNGGIVQLYFLGERLRIKINIDVMQKEGFRVDRTLLRIVDIVKKEKNP